MLRVSCRVDSLLRKLTKERVQLVRTSGLTEDFTRSDTIESKQIGIVHSFCSSVLDEVAAVLFFPTEGNAAVAVKAAWRVEAKLSAAAFLTAPTPSSNTLDKWERIESIEEGL